MGDSRRDILYGIIVKGHALRVPRLRDIIDNRPRAKAMSPLLFNRRDGNLRAPLALPALLLLPGVRAACGALRFGRLPLWWRGGNRVLGGGIPGFT